MTKHLSHERHGDEQGFSNPEHDVINEQRSRFGKMWDAALNGGVRVSKEGDKISKATSDAAPHIGNAIHNGAVGTVRFIHGLFTGRGR